MSRCGVPRASLFASLAVAAFLAGASAWAAEPPAAPQDSQARTRQRRRKRDGPQAKQDEPPKTPAEERADLYARLAASKDADETSGIIARLLHIYSESGSDTGDLLLQRARQAIGIEHYSDALKILDQTIALLPDWAEGWNARATARYLDDDYNGSMADIAQTLKREPKHLGGRSSKKGASWSPAAWTSSTRTRMPGCLPVPAAAGSARRSSGTRLTGTRS